MKLGIKQLSALMATLLVAGSLLGGCAGGKQGGQEGGQGQELKMAKDQTLRFNVGAEPQSLDPAKITGKPEGTIVGGLFEGMTRYDKNNKLTKAMAEDWQISEDGKKYTFKIRKDAKWSNGDPVTAADFAYSWKRALAPETASEYAYQLFYLKNAEKYNAGEAKADEVGVKAIDEKTLEVELEAPTPQFLGLTAFETLFPVHKATVEKNPDKWYAEAETIVTNGPFKMTKWVHNQEIHMAKNEHYWDKENVKLDNVVATLIDDNNTVMTLFETGQLHFAYDPPSQELKRLQDEGKVKIGSDLGTYFYRFNVTKKPFDDVRVRKALALAIDRNLITERVTTGGYQPAVAFTPPGFPDADPNEDYRKVGGDLLPAFDLEQAKKLLAEAGYPDGKGFPKTAILFNTNDNHQKIAQAIQEMWKKNLGIDVTLTNQEWQVYLTSQSKLDYDITRSGWSADYLDAMTFMDMFVTDGGNNQTGWSNKEFDDLIAKAKATGDMKERYQAMHEAEKILIEEMPIAPIYFYTYPYYLDSKLQDAIAPPLGTYLEFRWAWLAE